MIRRPEFKKFIGISIAVVLLYVAAINFSFFWIFDWYDHAMHVMGGLAIGYLAIATMPKPFDRNVMIIRGATFALFIGVLWEIFERVGNHYVPKLLAYGGPVDSLLDIAYAIIGALVIVLIESRKRKI